MGELLEVSVKVIQARHLQIEANSSTQVEVNIGEKYKYTKVVKFSDAPFFDEYFTFDYKLNLEDVLEKTVKFNVKRCRGLLSKVTIADFSLSLRDVWNQQGHQIHRQWAPLLHPTNLSAGPQGYLKVDIRILKAGELVPPPIQLDPDEEDFIEKNLILQREGTASLVDRQYAEYTVNIFQADGIPKLPSSLMSQLRQVVVGDKAKEAISPQISIRISDLEGRTSVKNTRTPIWNESLTFTEIFPPMWSNIRVQLNNYSSLGSTILAEHCIPLTGISNLSKSFTKNFPPTFGPSYIHLYSEHGKYAGRVQLSISTNILDLESLDEPPTRSVILSPCEPYEEESADVEMALFVALLEANMLGSEHADHKLTFQACFGSPYAPQGSLSSSVLPLVVRKGDEGLCSLPAGETAPCVSTLGTWPDRRHSMYIRNRILRLVEILERLQNDDGQLMRTKWILEDFIKTSTHTVAVFPDYDSYDAEEVHITQLDFLRLELRLGLLREFIESAKQSLKSGKPEEQAKLIQDLASRLRVLAEDPQQSGIPKICVRLLSDGGKLLAEQRIAPEDVIFSKNDEEIGILCTKPFPSFLLGEGASVVWDSAAVGKIRVFMWLGLTKEIPICMHKMPDACIRQQDVGNLFPSALFFTQKHIFECRAHIYQGSFVAGWDRSSLADPFLRISVASRSACTKVMHETLSPTWDETVLLWPIVMWGTIEYIAANPPHIVIEALDLDLGKAPDYVGRTTAVPNVQLLHSKELPKLPQLKWYTMKRGICTVAKILAAFELVQCASDEEAPNTPSTIRPRLCRYRLECLFWGMRGLTRGEHPSIHVECAGQEICSSVISDIMLYSNFEKPHTWLEIELPDNKAYLPPLTIKFFNHRNIVQPVFEGTCMVPSLQPFLEASSNIIRRQARFSISQAELGPLSDCTLIQIEENVDQDNTKDTTPLISKKKEMKQSKQISNSKQRKGKDKQKVNPNAEFENEELDWWSKLYATENKGRLNSVLVSSNPELAAVNIQMYNTELEAQPEFNGFMDLVRVFPLVKGHRAMDEDPPVVATFKGGFSLRPLAPTEDPESIRMNLLPPNYMQSQGPQQPVRVLARLYVVRGLRLRPKDADGLSDPYITVSTSLGQRVKDRENYVKGELNPVFGRCYEFELSLPKEHEIVIGMVDRDDSTADDVIGETRIDVEKRLMSCHRAHCGISRRYDRSGYNMWREGDLPSQILEGLCSQYGIEPPQLTENQITVGSITVSAPCQTQVTPEQLALAVLLRWKEVAGWSLVPEHIESRPLYLPRKPGVEQGRLHMWLDLFPEKGSAPGPPVNISPRIPLEYELRVIVWNAEEIPLDDTSVTGEQMSDIFFKCWLGEPVEKQITDVHYRSLTGEGQFNWRMIFPLRYLAAERRMVIKRHGLAGLFSRGEQQIPCILNIQAWDADIISADDFIGSTTLELCRLPPGAKTARTCVLRGAESGPPLNLFISQRTRGWWHLRDANGGPAGKVELEFEIIKAEAAAENPVGRGRDAPNPLPSPNRPDTSFLWLMNPARAARAILWKNYGKRIMCYLFLALVLFLTLSGLFVVPELLVRKLFSLWK